MRAYVVQRALHHQEERRIVCAQLVDCLVRQVRQGWLVLRLVNVVCKLLPFKLSEYRQVSSLDNHIVLFEIALADDVIAQIFELLEVGLCEILRITSTEDEVCFVVVRDALVNLRILLAIRIMSQEPSRSSVGRMHLAHNAGQILRVVCVQIFDYVL